MRDFGSIWRRFARNFQVRLVELLRADTVSEEDLCDRSILLSFLWAAFMNRDTLLIVLTGAGSALCVWPAAIEPSIDFPRWILLVLIALITGLATILSNARWLHFAVASTVGVLAGLWTGLGLFPPSDAISASYYPLFSVAPAMAVFVVSLLAALLCRNLSASRKTLRLSVWLVFASCVAFGPIALALTPPLVGHRVATNDRMAAERFESLKSAVEGTVAEGGDPARICDGQSLKRHYGMESCVRCLDAQLRQPALETIKRNNLRYRPRPPLVTHDPERFCPS